jgi:hypothetical protein
MLFLRLAEDILDAAAATAAAAGGRTSASGSATASAPASASAPLPAGLVAQLEAAASAPSSSPLYRLYLGAVVAPVLKAAAAAGGAAGRAVGGPAVSAAHVAQLLQVGRATDPACGSCLWILLGGALVGRARRFRLPTEVRGRRIRGPSYRTRYLALSP